MCSYFMFIHITTFKNDWIVWFVLRYHYNLKYLFRLWYQFIVFTADCCGPGQAGRADRVPDDRKRLSYEQWQNAPWVLDRNEGRRPIGKPFVFVHVISSSLVDRADTLDTNSSVVIMGQSRVVPLVSGTQKGGEGWVFGLLFLWKRHSE